MSEPNAGVEFVLTLRFSAHRSHAFWRGSISLTCFSRFTSSECDMSSEIYIPLSQNHNATLDMHAPGTISSPSRPLAS